MAYTNFTNCTEQEYLDIIYSQDDKNRIRIWFNNVELEDAGEYCESLSGTNRMLPDDGSKRFSLDNFVAREYDLVLRDLPVGTTIADQVKISIGTLVDSENDIYEDVPIGIFNIQDKPETDQNKVTIKLRDNRVKFDFGYDAQPLIDLHSGSATYKQILNDICTKAGVTNDVTTFNGESIAVSIYDNTIKGSAYVAYIAEQAGAIPVITREGHLDFVYLNDLKTWRIPLSIVEKYEIGKPFEVERVVYESGIIKYETSQDETLETLYLDAANPYISSQAQVNAVFAIMNGFTIDSATTGRILGNPAIDAYDLIEIYDDTNAGDNLPSEYTQVEYIESDGNCIIDTGILPTSNTKIDIDFEIIGSPVNNTWVPLFGRRSNTTGGEYSNKTYFAFFFNNFVDNVETKVTTNYAGADAGGSSQVILLKNTRHTLKNDGGSFYVDNVFESSISTTNVLIDGVNTIYLFDLLQTNGYGMGRKCLAKIYSCKFYEGNNLTRNFIPCFRNSDNEIGMYDLANNIFYTNISTGSFTHGELTQPTIFKTLANNTYTFNGVHRNTFDTTIGEEERKENVTISSEATNRRWAKTEIDNLNATVTITAGKVENLEQSIEVLSADLDSNIIPISVDENNIPFTAKTYQVGFTNKYVGEPIYITPTTNDLYNGVTTSATTTNINFTINNGTPLGRYVLTQDTTYQEGKSYFDSNYDELEEGVDYNVGDTITGTVYEVQTVSDLKYTFTWSYTDSGVTYTVSKMITISALYSEQQQEIVKSSTFPLDTNVLWYNTNDNKIYSYNGTDWVIVNSYDSQLGFLQEEINAKANASDVNQLTSTVANIQTNTYSKTQIQSIANGSGYFLSEDTVFGENTIYYTDTNGTVYTGSRTGSPLELGLYEHGAISAVISTEATFNRDGMTYAKTGAETTSTINQYGLEVDRTGTNEVALYAGYVPDDSFGDLYQSQTLVYTSNLVSRGYTEVGLHGRFEEYAGPNNEDGVGFFII